jgi:nicotinamide-nucleotide adenylyltransferase
MSRALFVGRFQPFHKGHLGAIKAMLRDCDEVVVAVGSMQKSHAPDNLFTAGERAEMIFESLKEEGLAGRALVVGIPDVNFNAVWAKHLMAVSPGFDVVYSNNPLVARLFSEEGVRVMKIGRVERERFDGTHIRKLMVSGGAWEELLPAAAAKVARRCGAAERLKDILAGDKE